MTGYCYADQKKYNATPRGKYSQQKANAWKRRIPWQITYEQWWQLWQASGHWPDRGYRRGQYVMGRLGDAGAYRVGNVEIILFEVNAGISQRITQQKKHTRRTTAVRFRSVPQNEGACPHALHQPYPQSDTRRQEQS